MLFLSVAERTQYLEVGSSPSMEAVKCLNLIFLSYSQKLHETAGSLSTRNRLLLLGEVRRWRKPSKNLSKTACRTQLLYGRLRPGHPRFSARLSEKELYTGTIRRT